MLVLWHLNTQRGTMIRLALFWLLLGARGGVLACVDTADGATDASGYGCDYYTDWVSECGWYDYTYSMMGVPTQVFDANSYCCACGGGTSSAPTVSPAPTTSSQCSPTRSCASLGFADRGPDGYDPLSS